MAALRLYELAGAEPERRFSPFCWRVRMALAHKGLAVETVPWHFTDKTAIAFSGQERVPVLVDGDRTVTDSWKIATYLEREYPARPSLFGGAAGEALARFVNFWVDGTVGPPLLKLVVSDIYGHLDEGDRAYFRETREARLGMSLEAVSAVARSSGGELARLRAALQPLRALLAEQPYLGGSAPLQPDYILFGSFMWARSISPLPLLERDDPVASWRERLLDAYDGLARSAPGYPLYGS